MATYFLTNDLVTVTFSDGDVFTVRRADDEQRYKRAAQALLDNLPESMVREIVDIRVQLQRWAGDFDIQDGQMVFKDHVVPSDFARKILDLREHGFPAKPLLKFYERLSENPSENSAKQIWNFMQYCNLPITNRGTFMAYKGVSHGYLDLYTRTIQYTIGTKVSMPREQVEENPDIPCASGIHVGSLDYATWYAGTGRVILCEVDPADVVSVPNDVDHQKMRVSRLKVLGDVDLDVASATRRLVACPWAYLDVLEHTEDILNAQNLSDLRMWASGRLGMAGASKLRGGKPALVEAIMKTLKVLSEV